jgi:hypothetical protein
VLCWSRSISRIREFKENPGLCQWFAPGKGGVAAKAGRLMFLTTESIRAYVDTLRRVSALGAQPSELDDAERPLLWGARQEVARPLTALTSGQLCQSGPDIEDRSFLPG